MKRTYQRGEMYYADLGHGVGSEQEGRRPVVIIQNNVGNKHSPNMLQNYGFSLFYAFCAEFLDLFQTSP